VVVGGVLDLESGDARRRSLGGGLGGGLAGSGVVTAAAAARDEDQCGHETEGRHEAT
jgi:hypothetical protein